MGYWVDTWVILAVAVVNATIGFLQEGKAEQALEGIRKMLSAHARALRDGAWVEIEAETLVPGDIVRLGPGARVPADLRLLEAANLRIEESALTGESLPTAKDLEPVADEAGIGDRRSMAYSGTLVTGGQGLGVVTGTGAATEIGRINRMIAEVRVPGDPPDPADDRLRAGACPWSSWSWRWSWSWSAGCSTASPCGSCSWPPSASPWPPSRPGCRRS